MNYWTCTFVRPAVSGNGAATSGYSSSGTLSFRLPGENNSTYGTPMAFAAVAVNGSVHGTRGTFEGTDRTTGKVVFGWTNTNVSVIVHCCRGGSYPYALVNGSIVLHPTKMDGTSTSFSGTKSSLTTGQSTTCTVTVTDLRNSTVVPTGYVSMRTRLAGGGHFSNHGVCTVVAGTCRLRYTTSGEFVGTETMYATYHGTSAFYRSQGATYEYVTGG